VNAPGKIEYEIASLAPLCGTATLLFEPSRPVITQVSLHMNAMG